MRRRKFIGNTLAGGALLGGSLAPKSVLAKQPRQTVQSRETGKYDILLKGGHVIDPLNNINSKKMDVAVANGKISVVGRNIPSTDAKKTIDANGLYVSPGFIDIHAHGFYSEENTSLRWIIFDDHCFPSGVTTVLDVGSSGSGTFEKFKKIIDRSLVRTFALINISYSGMNPVGENNPLQFQIPQMVELAKKYPEIIVGFKTAHYWTNNPYDDFHTPWASVDAVIEAGHRAELPVMIDMIPRAPQGNFPARSRRELILEKLRPGDIDTHCFKPHYVMIDENGKLRDEIFKAQERGVIFDVGHGAGSFVWRNAVPAIEQGFLPNSISTDLHSANTNGKVMTMANVMSKFLALGVSLEDVIRLSTTNPAREINHPELGNLSVGSTADIAVFEILDGKFSYTDVRGGKNYGSEKLHNIMTLMGGEIVSDPFALGGLYWKDIKDKNYWVNESGQYW